MPIDLQAPKRSSWSMELENGRLIDIGGNEGQVSPERERSVTTEAK